jgi:hypothetical protein
MEDPAVFQEAKEYLRGVPGGGVSVYDHLTQVLVKILDEKPSDANALFEEISAAVRDSAIPEPKVLQTEAQLVSRHHKTRVMQLDVSHLISVCIATLTGREM